MLPIEQLLTGAEDSAGRLENLALEADRLEAVAAETEEELRELARERRELAERADELARERTALQSESERVAAAAEELRVQKQTVDGARATLEHRVRALDAREAAFASRWRWLLRAWSWRPHRPGGPTTRTCEFLFVATSDGYRLLEQEGVALRKGSRLTGLLAEEHVFVVTKIAPWSFDGRWCAYVQQEGQQANRKEGSA